MRAVAIDRFGTRGDLRDLPDPTLTPEGIVVRVTFAGVNPVDWKIRDGMRGERAFPLVLGQDFAGIVEQVGERVQRVKPGDRVFGCAREKGSYAQRTALLEGRHGEPFARIPRAITDQQAAALPTPGVTALASLEILGVSRGTSLLIVGAAGAVGRIALQIALHRHAYVAAVVRPGQEREVLALGAHDAIAACEDLVQAVRTRHPEPFDAYLDLVSDGGTLKRNEALLEKGGRLVSALHVADEAWFRERGITATNVVMYQTPQSSPEGLRDVARLVAGGVVRVDVTAEKPLAEAPSVLDDVKSRRLTGKVVLRV